jgi:hypothetical protein
MNDPISSSSGSISQEDKSEGSDTNEWKSFCFKVNPDFLKFFVQISISFIILGLSIYKLIVIADNGDEKNLYVSLLTLILGIYTPQPTIKKNKN